jgi:hypothetical protein
VSVEVAYGASLSGLGDAYSLRHGVDEGLIGEQGGGDCLNVNLDFPVAVGSTEVCVEVCH